MKAPSQFLSHFKQEFKKLPKSQSIPEIPPMDWDKYKLPSLSHVVNKPETRYKGVKRVHVKDEPKEKIEGLLDCKVEKNAKGQFLVRGRIFDTTKPQTFNQPWTPEEQRRLEELLEEFPSEEIEMVRWKKIANSLGNRTPVQIQSRVQKYFQKLQKAGLPVPGRYKKSTNPGGSSGSGMGLSRIKRPSLRGKYSNSLIGSRNSTFFPDMKPNIRMTDEDEREADNDSSSGLWSWNGGDNLNDSEGGRMRLFDASKYYVVDEDVSDEEDIDPTFRKSPPYIKLKWLKRVRREREIEQSSSNSESMFVHTGYR
jgi:hypothetical protein